MDKCTKVKCPLQAGMQTDHCADNCPWRTEPKKGDLISRAAVLRCIKESREGIDWGQSDDEDAFLHYTGALYRTIASKECFPAVDAVPVVRCADCKYCFDWGSDPMEPYDGESDWYCERWDREANAYGTDPYRFYCADGERRESE